MKIRENMPVYRIGIDLGGTNIKAGVVSADNQLLASYSCKTLVQRPWREVVADMAMAAGKAAETLGISLADCVSCGVGSPGTVNAANGMVIYSNNFDWENIPLGETLSELMQMPVKVSNDANCAALGECVAGAAKDVSSAVLLTLGTGVGGGVVFDGKVFEGGPGGAELGHTCIVGGGELCTCGRKGCLEAYASATALIREASRAATVYPESSMNELLKEYGGEMNGIIPFSAAQSGDAVATAVVERYIDWLGKGIVDLVNIFRPEVVLLAGGVCAQGENLTKPLTAMVKEYAFGGARVASPEVKIAALGNDAGILGAANLI
ncbi:MAG: ROK family protein [Faecalibacterium sp.]